MSKQYTWAVNPSKLQRAIAKVAPKNGTEEDIKAEYILIGGLVCEVEVEEGVEEVSIEEAAKKWRSQFAEAMGYLAAGLAIFGALVWAIGWIVRGFLGIPRGMDKRPDL